MACVVNLFLIAGGGNERNKRVREGAWPTL